MSLRDTPAAAARRQVADRPIFKALFRRRGVVVVAQAGRIGEREKTALRARAEKEFGRQQVLRVAPPLGTRTDDLERRRAEFFAVMGRQAELAAPTASASQFQDALQQRTNGRPFVLLVSGFEHGTPELQREFGSCRRSFYETYVHTFPLKSAYELLGRRPIVR